MAKRTAAQPESTPSPTRTPRRTYALTKAAFQDSHGNRVVAYLREQRIGWLTYVTSTPSSGSRSKGLVALHKDQTTAGAAHAANLAILEANGWRVRVTPGTLPASAFDTIPVAE